ncbi:MAG: FHA domain-containing protein, partial [Desulfobacterales bacterium]
MVRIVLKFNSTVLKELESDDNEITIGRDADSDIQIDNVAVSRKHAIIRKAPNYYYIEDLNSTNGTFVNEKHIVKKVLY